MLTTARSLTRSELAEATGFSDAIIKQMCADGSIPATFYRRGDGREFLYTSATVALLALVSELHDHFGSQSRIPREVARHLSPDDILRAWREPRTGLRVLFGGDAIEVKIRRPVCFAAAHERLAAMA